MQPSLFKSWKVKVLVVLLVTETIGFTLANPIELNGGQISKIYTKLKKIPPPISTTTTATTTTTTTELTTTEETTTTEDPTSSTTEDLSTFETTSKRTTTTTPPTTSDSTDPTTSPSTTTVIPILPEESIDIVDQHAGRNEMRKYAFELPQDGANFHFELSEGQCIGFYSFSNDSPDERDKDGFLNIPGDTRIMPGEDLQQIRKVFISVKGILEENVFSFSAEAISEESSTGFGEKINPNFYVMLIIAVFRLVV